MNFEALIKTLEAQIVIYNELLQVQIDKTSIIIEGNVEKLDKVMNTEQVITMIINALEKKRMGIMDGLGLSNKTLRDVIAIAKNDESKARARLFKIYKDLKECTDQIKEVNEHNSILLKARLEVITGFTDYMQSGIQPKINKGKIEKMNTYDKNAKIIPQSSRITESTIKKRF
jgi:flagellar biosynthesis/type III secretory pathway chaperone